jgi:glycosyltransferase involved in cell wall biosynthesis
MSQGTVPLVSVITPSRNRAATIAQAVESVLQQEYPAIEHIIIDGGSTDDTLEVLARYPHLRVISRPDEGMYFALNDGLRLAQGDVIGFLNSDDLYPSGALAAAMARLRDENVDAVAGRAVYFIENPQGQRRFFRPTRPLTQANLWHELTYGDPSFNAWFFQRTVFERLGGLDPSYRIAGDREFLLRFALAGLSVTSLEEIIYTYRVHSSSLSLSTDIHRFAAVADESLRLIERYFALVPSQAQKAMLRMRTRDTITAASRTLRSGDFECAWRYAREGWRHDLLWPLKFLWRLFTGLFRSVGRRLSLYPPI